MSGRLRVNGTELVCEPSGALWWPERGTLVVADLHFEKGSAFAAQGQLLPPYDTAATLTTLESAVARHRPERVICLGDSFHDQAAETRMAPGDVGRLRALTAGRDWVWIAGNHDPAPPDGWGGRVLPELTLGALTFRHEADDAGVGAGEVSGHFHPKAAVKVRSRRLSARCFVSDGRRLILPAFGAYAGGLNVLESAIARLFPRGFHVQLLGRRGLYRYGHKQLAR